MCIEITKVLQEHKPDIVVTEKTNVMTNTATLQKLYRVIDSTYMYSVYKKSAFYYEMSASEWRGELGMQGKLKRPEYKALSVKYVKDRFGLEVTDDESDSICIGIAYIQKFTN